jgi:uncharacterized Rossmann fold enzyme
MKNIKFLLVWILIGFTITETMKRYSKYNKEREIEDKEIKELFKLKRKYSKF